MGREVRRVPANWSHPKRPNGQYEPLFEGTDFTRRQLEWDYQAALWEAREHEDQVYPQAADYDFADWDVGRPRAEDYMPEWTEAEKTHFQMYETTSEGTPISPIFPTPEELACWLSDTGASAFGGMTVSYESWLRVARGGFAPSLIATAGGLSSGVEGPKE